MCSCLWKVLESRQKRYVVDIFAQKYCKIPFEAKNRPKHPKWPILPHLAPYHRKMPKKCAKINFFHFFTLFSPLRTSKSTLGAFFMITLARKMRKAVKNKKLTNFWKCTPSRIWQNSRFGPKYSRTNEKVSANTLGQKQGLHTMRYTPIIQSFFTVKLAPKKN